ncbi:MAG: glucose 1-dehydrogenase, partial [Rhodospirillaceae bacterium]|nr:glucose 1-dehydrogenase [Rhodospirillaceae bacterium]
MAGSVYDVSGKVALVTGGASGIGAETARLLAAHGAKVAVADINEGVAKENAAAIEAAGGQAMPIALDVIQEASWEAAVNDTLQKFGGVHILVNAAGIEMTAKIEDTSLSDFKKIIAVNLEGVFLGMKYAMPAMRAAGGGSIINISSIAGIKGFVRQSAYVASKGGVRLITKAAAAEAAHYGYNVRVNSVHPGAIDTPMVRDMIAHHDEARQQVVLDKMRDMHPIGRMGQAIDIANAILFLASEASSFMTGSEVVVDGGFTA